MQKDLRFKIILEGLQNGVSVTCKKYHISRTIYYRWLSRYKTLGIDGLDDLKKDFTPPNKTTLEIENAVLNLIKDYPLYGPKALKYLSDELDYTISESGIYNIMKRHHLTQKENRIKFAKKQENKMTPSIPTLGELSSGECWLFWITAYGHYENIGNLYEYTFYDLKSRIACTRLYSELSFDHFEDLLTAVALPIAKTLHLKVNYLCFFKDTKLLNHSRKIFKSNVSNIISDHGCDFKVHILLKDNDDLAYIDTLRKIYTEGCLSYLLPLIHRGLTLDTLKIKFQDYARNYNLHAQSLFGDESYSPIEYHNKLTQTKLILPIWAYIDRNY